MQRCNCGYAACKSAKVRNNFRVAGGGKVGQTILGRPSGRAGMLDPTRCRHCRDAVSTLPCSADDEGEEGEDEDDDDDEAAAVWPAAIDATLPLIPEFPVVAHFVRS